MRGTGIADRQNPVVGTRLFPYFICQVKNLTLNQFTPAFHFGGNGTISFLYILYCHLVLSSTGIGFIYVFGLLVVGTKSG